MEIVISTDKWSKLVDTSETRQPKGSNVRWKVGRWRIMVIFRQKTASSSARSISSLAGRISSVHGGNCICHHCQPHHLLADGEVILWASMTDLAEIRLAQRGRKLARCNGVSNGVWRATLVSSVDRIFVDKWQIFCQFSLQLFLSSRMTRKIAKWQQMALAWRDVGFGALDVVFDV
jgi:hypothetical protein